MVLVKSLAFGYLGAVIAGVLVTVFGMAMGLSQETIVTAAAPTGIVFGTLGLSLAWVRPIAARVRGRH